MLQISLSAAVIAAGVLVIAAYRPRKPLPVRPSVTVLGFRDLAAEPETAWISAAASELMHIDLGAEQRLRLTPLEDVARMDTELSLTPQAEYSARLLQRIRANLGSDYVVGGSYKRAGGRIHFDLMLFDARSGVQMAAIDDESTEASLPELIHRCTGRIRAQLGVRLDSNAIQSFGTDSMGQYARGMELLRQGDALNARPILEKAVQAAPSNPFFHSGLAAAWSALGLDIRAGKEAELAYEDSVGLTRVEQLEIEGGYREIARDWPRAIQIYQALFTLLPDDLEYGLHLAWAQTRGGQGRQALQTVQALRALPRPLGDDPRVDLAEARAAGSLSDFARTATAARSAAAKAQARGARLLYAKARLLESGAMQNLVLPGFAAGRVEARRVCTELGDRACVAATYRIEANQAAGSGDPATARRLFQNVLEIASQIGNSLEKLNALTGLGYAAQLQGDLPAAEGSFRAALAEASEIDPQKCNPVYLELADVLADEGHIAEARNLIERALLGSQQSGEQEGIGIGEAALAKTLTLEAKSAAALDQYAQALKVLRAVNEPFPLSQTLIDYGRVQLDSGDATEARRSFAEAHKLAQSFQHPFGEPDFDLAFARLSLTEHNLTDAISHARSALSGFTSAGREAARYEAAAVLATALARQGNLAEASAALAQLPAPDSAKLPARCGVQFEIARCLVMAASGRRADAARAMDNLTASVGRRGIPQLARDAQAGRRSCLAVGGDH